MGTKHELHDAFELPPQKARTPIPDAKADRFVTSKSRNTKKAASSGKMRRDAIEAERLNAYLPRNLVERLRERAFRERRSLSDALSEALERWLGRDTKVL